MDLEGFKDSLAGQAPPPGLSLPVQALWHDGKGDWERAHALAQQDDGRDGAWVHAYLHRKEGDLSNASYWYRRAGRPQPATTLDEEWHQIAQALLVAP